MARIQKALFLGALGAFVAVALGGGPLGVNAQPEDGQDDTSEPTPETASVGGATEASPAEMRAATDANLIEMQNVLVRVVELQQLARKQKDVIKLNCVNEKLLQVKQLLNIAESSRTNMVEFIAQQDDAGTTHEASQVAIAKDKTAVLSSEAEGCIGEELVFLGPTQVSTDAPNATDDPTEESDNGDWDAQLDPPSYASPFL